jgi:hypothetical protein
VGQNLGHGFTGRSGGERSQWIEETMDLSPYAGRTILLRFYHVTDQSYHGSGFALDDISIPEIDFYDDAEADTGWDAAGFIRSVNAVALDWAVQIVAYSDEGPQIIRLPLTRDDSGNLSASHTIARFGDAVRRVVVAVSPLAPVTLEPADYRLDVELR